MLEMNFHLHSFQYFTEYSSFIVEFPEFMRNSLLPSQMQLRGKKMQAAKSGEYTVHFIYGLKISYRKKQTLFSHIQGESGINGQLVN